MFGVVDGAAEVCRRRRRVWLASISRSTSSGPTSAIAAIQASARPRDGEAEAALLVAARCRRARLGGELRAAGGDEDAGGEEEDRAQRRRSPRTSRSAAPTAKASIAASSAA